MQLYNTLTRKVEELRPIKPGVVTLYSCGPTVYNYYHIGNLRNAVFNDTLRRTLEATGFHVAPEESDHSKLFNVKHVMNITDVGHLVSDADAGEDKLETGAQREGKTVWEVAAGYTEAFKADMAAMNVLPPTHPYARATEFIPQQIEMVKALIDKGFAYVTKQAIYFEVAKLPDYGALSGQKLADKEVAARADVVTDPDKRSPHDFAVWFFTVGRYADHTMHWSSPWGDGFPGWHLECSAIIHATLGDPIDIHTGGVDHIGTHHPNEMAQTEAAYGHQLANVWVHNEFMLVDGAKMSKSKGNSYTLKEVTDRGFHPLALRLLYLQSHYRSELNFSWDSLRAAQNALLKLYAWGELLHQPQFMLKDEDTARNTIAKWYLPIHDALTNDLDTPVALALVFDLTTTEFSPIQLIALLLRINQAFGLSIGGTEDITTAQKKLISERETARQAKDWAKSDELRAELAKNDLEIDDTPAGPRWRRTSIK